jgi:hypothetical protein
MNTKKNHCTQVISTLTPFFLNKWKKITLTGEEKKKKTKYKLTKQVI